MGEEGGRDGFCGSSGRLWHGQRSSYRGHLARLLCVRAATSRALPREFQPGRPYTRGWAPALLLHLLDELHKLEHRIRRSKGRNQAYSEANSGDGPRCASLNRRTVSSGKAFTSPAIQPVAPAATLSTTTSSMPTKISNESPARCLSDVCGGFRRSILSRRGSSDAARAVR